MLKTERRLAARIQDKELNLKFRMNGFDSSAHTLNISTSGLYFKADKEMPLMTRIELMLMLPDVNNGVSYKPLIIEGIVVRTHPVIIDGSVRHYDVAVFFDSLDNVSRERIDKYIAMKKD